MWKRLRFSMKLVLLLTVPIVALIASGVGLMIYNKMASDRLIQTLYEEAYQANNLLLNADRDLYQALTAQRTLLYVSADGAKSGQWRESFEENAGQTKERVGQARTILEAQRERLEAIRLQESPMNAFEHLDTFFLHFEQWVQDSAAYEKELASGKITDQASAVSRLEALDESVMKARDSLDLVEAIIDSYAVETIRSIEESKRRIDAWTAAAIAILTAAVIAVGALLTRSVAGTLRQTVEMIGRMADGDLTGESIVSRSTDEFGRLADGMNRMAEKWRAAVAELQSSSDHVLSFSQQLTASSSQTSQASEHIAATMEDVSNGTERQHNSVDECVKAIDTVSAAAEDVAAESQRLAGFTEMSGKEAVEGAALMSAASIQMQSIRRAVDALGQTLERLSERSGQIGEMARTITDISTQTNLLALNASIEAARAGEHGRGFAVVAGEVRKLAEQSEAASKLVTELIGYIGEETDRAADVMEQTRAEVSEGVASMSTAEISFEKIRSGLNEVSVGVEQTGSSMERMAANVNRLSELIRGIALVAQETTAGTQNVSAATEQQLASMEEIASNAEELTEMAKRMKALVSQFRIQAG
ncbi:methyl-accepting chemotaxis protein [Paenibacillus alkalitolerans]|uniref:methyl-accepting chemotaxis protein n=1 Tax=Paenibacillus alkalitolerans TaxID=2799335 RepID=UPI0018F7A124|nr:methyl-accepting chemotaxis protein [Paenibacillus alkalitolerans]